MNKPRIDQGPDYERGFIDGMQYQMQSSVDKAVNRMAQPEQEPVAWIHNFIEGGISIGKRPTDLDRHPDRWTALYPEAKPCPTCEALARTVMLDQTYHDTITSQRTWVGLTDEEKEQYVVAYYPLTWDRKTAVALMNNYEAYLKEKNT